MITDQLDLCGKLIVEGRLSQARVLLEKVTVGDIPINLLVKFGSLCRRTGLYDRGLRALRGRLFLLGQKHLDPTTDSEKAEYAALLSRMGGVKQALGILKNLGTGRPVDAHLFETFCYLAQWDFLNAESSILKYLSVVVDPYARLVAQVNLVSALIGQGRFGEAQSLIDQALPLAEASQANRLQGNFLQLKAQALFWEEKYESALAAIRKSIQMIQGVGTQDQFLITKWEKIIRAFEQNGRQELVDFQRHCFKNREWETAREVDRFLLHIEMDQRRFDRLFYGTPHACYRQALKIEFSQEPSREYAQIGASEGPIFDPKHWTLASQAVSDPGSKVKQLVGALFADFYMPARAAGIFADVYPDEIFDIESSPLKIRQLLQRLRGWLENENIPIQISEWRAYHRVRPAKEASVRIYLDYGFGQSNEDRLFAKLCAHFSLGQSFSSSAACEVLGLSRSSFLRFANWGTEQGYLSKTGSYNKVSYQRLK